MFLTSSLVATVQTDSMDVQMGLKMARHSPSIPPNIEDLIPVRKPTWGLDKADDEANTCIKATWLGHACLLVELPKRDTSRPRGARILFDPVFRDRCSPTQYLGPKRFTRKLLCVS